MYFPHEASAKLAAAHNKNQVAIAKDRAKRMADRRKYRPKKAA